MRTMPSSFQPHTKLGLVLSCVLLGGLDAWGGEHGSGSPTIPSAEVPAAASGGGGRSWRNYPFPYYQTVDAQGRPITIIPPMPPIFVPAVLVPVPTREQPPRNPDRFGLAGPLPRQGIPRLRAADLGRKRVDPERAKQLVTFGDRLFRGGNTKRAEERYEQAIKADALSAAPWIRMAQLSLGRGQYGEAADHLRNAFTADPGWVFTSDDIQSLYSEPADFAKQIARLESHLQAEPGDRDAWLVLGAQWYLSGRTQKAADIFTRLSDRKPEPVLEALQEAARINPPEPEVR